jgi:hypothetical protein
LRETLRGIAESPQLPETFHETAGIEERATIEQITLEHITFVTERSFKDVVRAFEKEVERLKKSVDRRSNNL